MGLSQKSLTQIEKFFLFRVPMNPQKDWKAKLERAHFFKVQSGKIIWKLIKQNKLFDGIFDRIFDGIFDNPYLTEQKDSAIETKKRPFKLIYLK